MPEDQPAHAALPRSGTAARFPGLPQAVLVAACSALLFGAGLASRDPAAPATGPGRLAAVSPADTRDALGTVSGTAADAANSGASDAPCTRHLAWVTIARAPGQPEGGRIRLRSGAYVSPSFPLLDTPTRVALPYPAPYDAGRGTLAVFGQTAGAVIALQPAWHVSAADPQREREVTWHPDAACRTPGR